MDSEAILCLVEVHFGSRDQFTALSVDIPGVCAGSLSGRRRQCK